MNIAIFASQFYPHIGGVEELMRQLAREQLRRGDRPLIVSGHWPNTLPAEEKFEGLSIRRYGFCLPGPNLRQMLSFLLHRPGTVSKICHDLRTHKTDLIHIQCVGPNAYYALLAKRRLKIPLVVTLQGELTMDATGFYGHPASYGERLLPMVLKEADAITACSQHTLTEAEKFFGSNFGKRGHVIHNGVRTEEFLNATSYIHTRPYILGIGRFVPQKGFDVLLRAFAMTVRGGNETHDLLLAGDGYERDDLERLSGELGISSRVRFLGNVPHADAIHLFAGCSFCVLPSRSHEGLPVVSLEAMAAGKAVIASHVGGISEAVVDGRTGMLVPPEDASALSEAMTRLLSDVKLRERLGEEGCVRVQGFSWPIIAEQYASVYKEVLHG
jgi:glycogen(starch) synthase